MSTFSADDLKEQQAYWTVAVFASIASSTRNKAGSPVRFTPADIQQEFRAQGVRWTNEDLENFLEKLNFGEAIIVKSKYAQTRYMIKTDEFLGLSSALKELADLNDCAHVYQNYTLLGSGWLWESITSIIRLHADAEDNSSGPIESEDDEWEPLELEYDTAEAQEFQDKLEEAVIAIEGDNGFAAHHPAERQQVVSTLKHAQSELAERAPFTKVKLVDFLVKPLLRTMKRLGQSVTGEAAKGALSALRKWVEQNITNLFDGLF